MRHGVIFQNVLAVFQNFGIICFQDISGQSLLLFDIILHLEGVFKGTAGCQHDLLIFYRHFKRRSQGNSEVVQKR